MEANWVPGGTPLTLDRASKHTRYARNQLCHSWWQVVAIQLERKRGTERERDRERERCRIEKKKHNLALSIAHFTAVGSSLARVTCETSQVLLMGGQVFISSRIGFLEDLPIQFTQLKMSEIILTDRKPQMGRKEKHKMWKEVYLRVIHGISGIFFSVLLKSFFLAVPTNCNYC